MTPAQERIMWSGPKLGTSRAIMKLFSPFPNTYQHEPHGDQWEPGSGKRAVDILLRLMVSQNYCY